MQIVASTPIVLLLAAFLFVRGPYKGIVILAAALPFGMMAAFNLPAIGGMSITSTDLLLLTMFLLLLLRRDLVRDLAKLFSPGSMALTLALLLLYATMASLFLPRIYAGETIVFSLSRVANQDGIVSVPLTPSNANLSQLFRLSLALCAFLVIAVFVRRSADPGLILRAIKWATGVHFALGIIDVVSAEIGMSWIMSPFRTANYSLTLGQELVGIRRMIGGFPEASTYGYFALGLFGFWTSHFLSKRAAGETGSGIWLALATFALLRCTSSSAYVGAAGFLLVLVIIKMRSGDPALTRSGAAVLMSVLVALPLLVAGVYVAYQLVPSFEAFVDRSLLDKLSSDSGVERMSWNAQAFRNFLDTHMLGAGLGSVRASNWVAAALASLGLPGTIMLLVFYWRLFSSRPAFADRETEILVAALKMGCLALIMRSLVVHGTPNMGVLFFFMAGGVAGLAAVTSGVRSKARVQQPIPVDA